MRRRDLLAAAGAVAIGFGDASASKRYRIAMLRASPSAKQIRRFKQRLAELGYEDGRDFGLEIFAHQGRIERLPDLAAELARGQPDVIIASGPEAVLKAISSATTTIPIVFLAVDYDPVALGYVGGLARPGGNLTGLFLQQIELTAKRVELLKDAIPALTTVGVLTDAFTTDTSGQMRAANMAASRLRLKLLPLVVPGAPPYDYTKAIETARAQGAGAILALMSPAFFLDRERLVQALTAQRTPASFGLREFTELGGLMSYGANIVEMNGRAADYVAKILKGAKPSELPVEQPTKFELLLNLRTAKEFGLALPQSIVARADEVIE
jgi:putative ABC transport system substrate-binding protein